MDIQRIAQEMRPVIYQAGHIAMKHYCNVKAERKADRTLVTEADRDVEHFLREEIQRRYPEHGFYGEESGHYQVNEAEYVWAIDPIDGTAPFVFELPIWAVSVGLLHEDRVMVGFVYLPVLDQLYWAVEGYGAYLNHQKIHVSEDREMIQGTTIVAPTVTFNSFETRFQGRALSFGSAAAHMCFVAQGHLHGGIIDAVRLYDIAASAVIIHEAGGVLKYLDGESVDLWELLDGRRVRGPFVFGNEHNIEQLRKMFFTKT